MMNFECCILYSENDLPEKHRSQTKQNFIQRTLCCIIPVGCELQTFFHNSKFNIHHSSVGVARFELTTSCSQSRRDTRLRYTPFLMINVYE